MNTLPTLREELTLSPGPTANDGSPTWNLYDPSRNCFFRINWQAFEILSRWDMGDPNQVAHGVNEETTLHTTPEDILLLLRFFANNHLLRPATAEDSQRLAQGLSRLSWWQWLLHNYLFFRIPLFRPDRWLTTILPYTEKLISRKFLITTLWITFLAIFLISRQWDNFVHSFSETISPSGFIHYLQAIIFTKGIHELSHALVAKRFGCRVPTMGIAFMVMWPVPYTDTTDSWKLVSRQQRLWVGSAGIIAELTIAAYATLAWIFLPEGDLRATAFILATTTWISTLLINLSPFMRFDGYFLFMDWLDMPNLHSRSFAMARWFLRERLFGLGYPPPEEMTAFTRRMLIIFALITWIYRLIIFLGIAFIVYHFAFKLLGIFLFAVEIAWFVTLPIYTEIKTWWYMRQEILPQPRTRLTGLLAIALLLVLFLPWQSHITVPAIMQAQEQVVLYAPKAGKLLTLVKAQGESVEAGELIAILDSPDIQYRLSQVQSRIKTLNWEISSMGFEPSLRERAQAIAQELEGAVAERVGIEQELAKLHIRAPMAGILADIPPELHTGQWLPYKERLASLLSDKGTNITAYLPEKDIARVHHGDHAIFHPLNPDYPASDCTIIAVNNFAAGVVDEPALTTMHGGNVPVREQQNMLVPEGTFYRVLLLATSETPLPKRQMTGTVTIHGENQSLGISFLHTVLAVVLRESGF